MNAVPPILGSRLRHTAASAPWRLGRIEIRSKITPGEEVVARVELVHADRGRITEIATGAGGVEAGFAAIGRILGVSARLERLSVTAVPAAGEDGSGCETSACVMVRCGGFSASGSAVSPDMLSACLRAYIKALLAAQKMVAGQPPA